MLVDAEKFVDRVVALGKMIYSTPAKDSDSAAMNAEMIKDWEISVRLLASFAMNEELTDFILMSGYVPPDGS